MISIQIKNNQCTYKEWEFFKKAPKRRRNIQQTNIQEHILNRERNPVLFQGGKNNENSTQYFSIKLL